MAMLTGARGTADSADGGVDEVVLEAVNATASTARLGATASGLGEKLQGVTSHPYSEFRIDLPTIANFPLSSSSPTSEVRRDMKDLDKSYEDIEDQFWINYCGFSKEPA
uniref:Uncharacterized protein n=1 Tax=Oryza sativa subsp. japonica TaxID=39947 RepID=Q84Q28_ORYSJ|nr:hypothetical protein [Oryza sativa Japonica Group]